MKARGIWIAALVAGTSYLLASLVVAPGPAQLVWKGAGVGLLALWAGANARSRDGWLLTTVLALGAAGDVLLDAVGFTVGGAVFLAGHLLAVWLYRRNARDGRSASQGMLALTLVLATPATAWLLTREPGVAVYSAGLGAMAGAAWLSRFPRYRLGVGAVLFVASDLVLFAGGPLRGLVWPLYFAGQALIATAGVRVLSGKA